MGTLRMLLFVAFFFPGTAVTVLAAFPIALLGRSALHRQALRWALYHRWCARTFLGIRSRVEGDVPHGAVLVAAKHQSMFETLELLVILDQPAVVVKRELADIPIWGKIAQMYGVIPVDRAGSAAALRRMLRAAREAQGEGRAIVIFPEGTRVLPGERPPLRAGFAGLYRQLGVPVVPVALDSGHVWLRRGFAKRTGVVTFRFGEAIPPGLRRDAIEARVHAAINALEG